MGRDVERPGPRVEGWRKKKGESRGERLRGVEEEARAPGVYSNILENDRMSVVWHC